MEGDREETEEFIPALGVSVLTPLYQTIVDVFCRDTHVKKVILSCIEGKKDCRILDIACGTGKLVKMLAQQQDCCFIIGQDLDPSMVQQATENVKDFDNVSITKGDATDLKEHEEESLDIVIESLVFHHLSDKQKCASISEIARVLSPTGVFYFVDWIKPQGAYAKVVFKIIEVLDGAANTRAHETNEVLAMIEEVFERAGELTTVQTSVGTIGIIAYGKK